MSSGSDAANEALAERELLRAAIMEELDVTYHHTGVVQIWHGRARIACGRGFTLGEACRSFVLHNPQSVSQEFRERVAALVLEPCTHLHVPYWTTANVKCCYSCGEPMEEVNDEAFTIAQGGEASPDHGASGLK